MTGKNPGATGVYGFQDREVDSYETYVPMGNHVKATRLWDRVTDDGRDATVLNVPVTFPPSSRIQRQVSASSRPGSTPPRATTRSRRCFGTATTAST